MSKNILIGIDEAGLGPRLGPLVVTLVRFEREKTAQHTTIDKVLSDLFSMKASLDAPQLRLGDSKIIYRGPEGLAHLEKTALTFWWAMQGRLPETFADWVKSLCFSYPPDFTECPWYGPNPGELALPLLLQKDKIRAWGSRLKEAMDKEGFIRFSVNQRIVTAPALNRSIARLGLKSEALIDALASLVRFSLCAYNEGSLYIDADKLGGRNYYSSMLQRLFPLTLIRTQEEGRASSAYSFRWQDKQISIRFLRKGDQLHSHIALASIFSKYTRELCMYLFNRFWTARLNELKPTAGYPTDAARFLEEISPLTCEAGLDPQLFVRVK